MKVVSRSYRYGFNGKEKDNEIKGVGNSLDFGARVYDSRLGRFLSVDPMAKSQPSNSSYSFAGNKPVACIDLDGEIEKYYTLVMQEQKDGTLKLVKFTEKKVVEYVNKSKLDNEPPIITPAGNFSVFHYVVLDVKGRVIENKSIQVDDPQPEKKKGTNQTFGMVFYGGGWTDYDANETATFTEALNIGDLISLASAAKTIGPAGTSMLDVLKKLNSVGKSSKKLEKVLDLAEKAEDLADKKEKFYDPIALDMKPKDTVCTGCGQNKCASGANLQKNVRNANGDVISTIPPKK
jgi:RHS repeat-associated protein